MKQITRGQTPSHHDDVWHEGAHWVLTVLSQLAASAVRQHLEHFKCTRSRFKQCSGGSRTLAGSLQSVDSADIDGYRQSFDLCSLRALAALEHSSADQEQHPLQTTYEEHFGLQRCMR